MSDYKLVKNDVPITFIIDRVTGNLDIKKVSIPTGYKNSCNIKEKIL